MTKVAVVGCGYWGKNLVRNFYELGYLSAICDENAENAQSVSHQNGHVPILTPDQILESEDINAVAIASPAVTHADLAAKFLKAGKHVFVEKPLAVTLEDGKNLQTLAEKQAKVLMVGHLLQYHPAYIKLKQLVKEGKIGSLDYIYSNRLSLGKVRTEEDVLWSFAPHDLSMVLGLVDDVPVHVKASLSSGQGRPIADHALIEMSFKNGVNSHIFVSWLHPFKEQRLVVCGAKGSLVFDDSKPWEEKIAFYPSSLNFKGNVPQIEKYPHEFMTVQEAEPLKNECQHFIDCIEQNRTPVSGAQEAIRVLTVLDMVSTPVEINTMMKTSQVTNYFKHDSAYIDEGVTIGEGTKIWHFSHILKGVTIGQNTIIGQNVMIGPDVSVGNNCKIQNNVSLYSGIILEDGVFCGPSCVFTNVNNPRAEIERKNEYRKTHIEKGVTIGANATIVCGVRLGAYSFVGAGATVTKDVPPHALVVGIPAKQSGWVSHAGEILKEDLICHREGRQYKVVDRQLVEIEEKK
ncbi:MAG: Gfo/Idh/MocA family oxidoreductase [Bacteroidota bacterium]|nr:Gfo/Idh/MocA family oxidoreductase [Bacteroidota bacterium]